MWQRWNRGLSCFQGSDDNGASWFGLPNIAYKNVDNQFSAGQTFTNVAITGGLNVQGGLTSSPGVSNFGQVGIGSGLWVYTPGITVVSGDITVSAGHVKIDAGNLSVGGIEARAHVRASAYLYDLARGYPVGYPVDGGTLAFSSWTWGGTICNEWSWHGNNVIWEWGFWGSVPAAVGEVDISLPNGFVSAGTYSGACGYNSLGIAMIWFTQGGDTWLRIRRVDGAAIPVGAWDIRGQSIIRI